MPLRVLLGTNIHGWVRKYGQRNTVPRSEVIDLSHPMCDERSVHIRVRYVLVHRNVKDPLFHPSCAQLGPAENSPRPL